MNTGQGFLPDRGVFTAIDVPLAAATLAIGINNRGQIVDGQVSTSAPD